MGFPCLVVAILAFGAGIAVGMLLRHTAAPDPADPYHCRDGGCS